MKESYTLACFCYLFVDDDPLIPDGMTIVFELFLCFGANFDFPGFFLVVWSPLQLVSESKELYGFFGVLLLLLI